VKFDIDAYHAWRREHPTRPLPRDVEESLLVEVTLLRFEVGMLQQEARIRKNLCDGLAAEAEAERAAVVAWLREGAGGEQGRVEYADDIERGEHRREEEP
jgi:hypothetical protein